MIRSGDWGGCAWCLTSSGWSWNHSLICVAVFMRELSSWSIIISQANSVCISGYTCSCKIASHSLGVVGPCRVVIGPNDSHKMAALTIRHCGLKPFFGFFRMCSCPDERKRVKDNATDHINFSIAQVSGFVLQVMCLCTLPVDTIVWRSQHHFLLRLCHRSFGSAPISEAVLLWSTETDPWNVCLPSWFWWAWIVSLLPICLISWRQITVESP